VEENSQPGTLLGRIFAQDEDANDTIRYSLDATWPVDLASVLSIDPVTGEVSVGPAAALARACIMLDYEDLAGAGRKQQGLATVQVRATDSGGNSGLEAPMSTVANFTLSVTNVNEAPVFLFASNGSLAPPIDASTGQPPVVASFSLVENAPFAALVGTVMYYDEDTAHLDLADMGLRFRIVGGDVDGIFTIGSDPNWPANITVRRPAVDYERTS